VADDTPDTDREHDSEKASTAEPALRTRAQMAADTGGLIVAVDVGSARVGCAVGEIERGDVRVIAAESSTSYGVRGGDIVDMKRAAEAIRIAIESAAEKAEAVVKTVVVGCSGDVRISTAKAAMDIGREQRAITQTDVSRLKSFLTPEIPGGRRVVHRFDGPFSVGDLHGVESPEGLNGERLEMHASFLSVAGDRLDNILKAVRSAGVEVEAVALEPLATSLGSLSEDERILGAAVLDFGAGAFRGALWEGGRLRQLHVIGREGTMASRGSGSGTLAAIGGMECVTLALARRFRIAPPTAERLLRTHAALGEDEVAKLPPSVEVAAVDGLGSVHIETIELSRTLEELLTPSVRALREGLSGYSAAHSVGLVLTGGGACIRGLPAWVGKRFSGGPVRVGVPAWLSDEETRLHAETLGARGSTLAGLLLFGAQCRAEAQYRRQGSFLGRLMDSMRRVAASL
jgi:cell division protein FtsA